MSSTSTPKSSRIKVRGYRERLRKQGLRPIQIWDESPNSSFCYTTTGRRVPMFVACSNA
jgi:hypothetical protein